MKNHKVKFRITYTDTKKVDTTIKIYKMVAVIELQAGETRETWVKDIIDNGFRIEMKLKGSEDEDFGKEPFARRISPTQVICVDYEMA